MEDVYLKQDFAHPVNLKVVNWSEGNAINSIFVGEIKFIHILYIRFQNQWNTLLDLQCYKCIQ